MEESLFLKISMILYNSHDFAYTYVNKTSPLHWESNSSSYSGSQNLALSGPCLSLHLDLLLFLWFSTHKFSWTSFCPSNIPSLLPSQLGSQQTLFLLCGMFCSHFFPRLAPYHHFRPHLKYYKWPFLSAMSE